eukprot:56246-Rhodomonas_salina.3
MQTVRIQSNRVFIFFELAASAPVQSGIRDRATRTPGAAAPRRLHAPPAQPRRCHTAKSKTKALRCLRSLN